ncbi:DNA (cytosine-5)-methyltransferase 3A [Frankliniella fusca]|uniref:DNA (cytosine-5-)-methyltransferase n=1 Tax=Frankliniella fusca TaxID=407009 RepID=A0AAE1LSL1_9NEOP|nr:DNA (cytosine-5)-methyltransferase 3A [Frankliniella fusca]
MGISFSLCISHPFNDVGKLEFPFQVTSQSMSPRAPELTFQVVPIKKRRIRVLSLFDGISTALYVLEEKLNLDIDIFFSSEIDQKAIRIQRERWDGKIVQLGDVKKIDQTLLHSLGRIDLVLGGSPCDELSLVNWRGRGLNDPESSGHLFYNFKTIKEFFEKRMNGQGLPFFWLFENTNKMRCSVKEEISKHLQVHPVLICASQFLPMLRMRYFWGNIPNMENFEKRMNCKSSLHLSCFLKPGRLANLDVTKTITTNVSNQFSRKGNTLPVTMNGKETPLTLNEVELLFGFPEHYTDASNLSVRERYSLLAKGWCVPVVASVLGPLAEIFKVKEE